MTNKEKELVETYFKYKDLEAENKRLAIETKKALSTLAPHKVGEIVKWTEHRHKNVGTIYHPKTVDLGDRERKAVLVRVESLPDRTLKGAISLDYHYEFHPITKDGSISKNGCYVRGEYEWTGEIHESYKEQTGEV